MTSSDFATEREQRKTLAKRRLVHSLSPTLCFFILAGVPVRVVAVNHDTSIPMIERTYSRYIGDHADALARKALLDIGSAPGGNVVSIATAR